MFLSSFWLSATAHGDGSAFFDFVREDMIKTPFLFYQHGGVEMKKWKKYLESLNDISEIDNVIEKAAALKHQDLYKIACEIKQSKL